MTTASDHKKHPNSPLILLVNDNENNLYLLNDILEEHAYHHIETACDGRAAIKKLRTLDIDLLITDIQMPYLDGWRLSRMVRSGIFKCAANTPVLAISATYTGKVAEITAKENDINQFLSLPLRRRQDFIQAVEKCLSEKGRDLKPRLLIIEDDENTLTLATRILNKQFNIDTATDGQQGLEAWRKNEYDLILMDIMMPKISGDNLLEIMRQDNVTQAIVMMTADSTMDRLENLMLAGATDFIAKPFRPEQLRHVCIIAAQRKDLLISNIQSSRQNEILASKDRSLRKISHEHKEFMDNIDTIILDLDKKHHIIYANKAWLRIMGYAEAETTGKPLADFMEAEQRTQFLSRIDSLGHNAENNIEITLCLLTKSASKVWLDARFEYKEMDGSKLHSHAYLKDITQQKLTNEETEYVTFHDILTGLYNRHYFEISLERIVASCARNAHVAALLHIDIDNFKVINDTLSHHDGDIVLQEISAILQSRARDSDLLCRISGDEFALVLVNTNAEQVVSVADEIIYILNNYRYKKNEYQFTISASIGITLIDDNNKSSSDYLIEAGKARIEAKNHGGNCSRLYSGNEKYSSQLLQNVNWTNRVRDAIKNNLLEIYLQPIMKLSSGEITHHEALLRMHNADNSDIILPGEFIPVIERAGQMHTLDRWVVDHAIHLLERHPEIKTLAINLSGYAFEDPQLITTIENLISTTGVNPKRIIFEITETASIANIESTQEMIKDLHKIGCRFALDDFGTGFCSFSYLRHLPANYIKLDGSFIRRIKDDEIDYAMVRSMNEIAHVLGKETIAECVETEEILKLVTEIGVDYVQGYYIGHPKPLT